ARIRRRGHQDDGSDCAARRSDPGARSADRGKDIVAIGDSTFKVRGGNQSFLVREGKFAMSNRQVLSHAGTPGNVIVIFIVWECAGVLTSKQPVCADSDCAAPNLKGLRRKNEKTPAGSD